MAISTKIQRVRTGSATNSLGTMGRSIFNSTVGTYADRDTMNQIYKGIDKLNSPIETIYKKFDNEAFNGRGKADDLYALLASMNIESSSDFMNKNREFMKRLMRLNKREKDITLDAIGVDTTGESNTVTNEYVRHYNHVDGNDYYEDFVNTLRQNQIIGDETTAMQLESSNHFNYSGLHNDLYAVTQNLYPDDENKGTFANKWITENRNSLLYKTKKLFNSRKVKTIISRFHTDPCSIPSALDNAKTKYGLSHGRNLLTKEAEVGYNNSYRNGYDNPYCRVWTHHSQYDRYFKTIRPFSTVDNQGNYTGTISVEDFHNWGQFSDENDNTTNGQWGWKKKSNNGWQHSVLQDNGMPNITPKYINGEATNIHTKQCMFSIENLAWRGYDPYSFEQALSWEQRGPLGGRIMWFPPYGIQFSETTSASWESNTFLGRGEDVYTYRNTVRTGNLSFKMVVDHPSILDYVTWSNDNRHNVTDTDILRFLAGCGEGNGGSSGGNGVDGEMGSNGSGISGLRSLAKPTPLTDEYTQVNDIINAEDVITEEEKVEKDETPDEPTPNPDVSKIEEQMCFYVFYPNNYSGTYDDPYGGEGYRLDGKSNVEAIPYLIAGTGAQKVSSGIGDGKTDTFANDMVLNSNSTDGLGNGYEMNGDGLGYIEDNCISGTFSNHNNGSNHWVGLKRNENYKTHASRKWYYRIDGRYVYPQSSSEEKYHYYNQILKKRENRGGKTVYTEYKESYYDGVNFSLNKKIDQVYTAFKDTQIEKKDSVYVLKGTDSRVFTLGEVGYVLYDGKNEALKNKCFDSETDNITYLKDVLSEENRKRIKKVYYEGGASVHGYSETNELLSRHRGETAANWFINMLGLNLTPTKKEQSETSTFHANDTTIGSRTSGSEDTFNAKKWRYAKIIVGFETNGNTSAAGANNTGVENTVGGLNVSKISSTVSIDGETVNVDVEVRYSDVANNTSYSVTVREYYEDGTNTEYKTRTITLNQKPTTLKEIDFFFNDLHNGQFVNIISEGINVNNLSNEANNKGGKDYIKFAPTGEFYTDENGAKYPLYEDKEHKKWYLKDGEYISLHYAKEEYKTPIARYGNGNSDENRVRYDQEYHFFKVLKQTDPVVFNSLMDKLQYFDPAFHSMTPEGFNGRLTFLQQCMRQGNTVSASDGKFAKNSNNLAFGRAPYCVLRLGDFYNQMIVIDNISIDYDPLVWDLNVEGVGVQPLIANVQMSFKFVGGGDMTGPVRRLQNAMSFNYYANASLYDNRADRIERNWSDKTNGAIEHDEILDKDGTTNAFKETYQKDKRGKQKEVSEFYTTKMYR